MKDWTVAAALTLGASIAVACMVYDPSDLTGEGFGLVSGASGFGGALPDGGRAGAAPTGGGAGIAGASSGSGGAQAGHSGDGGDAGGGDAGDGVGGGDTGGTSGGAVGTAGSGGTGNTAGAPPVTVDPNLIDDCEDRDNRIKRIQHPPGVFRNGFWYTSVVGNAYVALLPEAGTEFDMEPHPVATPGVDPPNAYAFRLYAKQVTDDQAGDGAIGGFNFLEPKAPYDGSKFRGVSFWARSNKITDIRFKVPIKGTDVSGGVCAGNGCSDHYFTQLTILTDWKKFEVPWDESFQQEGWGAHVPFNAAELMSVEFFVPALQTVPEVELWIDDVAFIEEEEPGASL